MEPFVLNEDDGFLPVRIGAAEANLDTHLLGAIFADLGKQWDGSNEGWTTKAQEVFASHGLPGLSAKAALKLQEHLSGLYGDNVKKPAATPALEGAPGSLSPTSSTPSTEVSPNEILPTPTP